MDVVGVSLSLAQKGSSFNMFYFGWLKAPKDGRGLKRWQKNPAVVAGVWVNFFNSTLNRGL